MKIRNLDNVLLLLAFAVSMLGILYWHGTVNGVIVSPLWDTSSTYDQCFLEQDKDNQTITLNANSSYLCRFQVSATTLGTLVRIWPNFTAMDYLLYVESMDGCPNRVATFRGFDNKGCITLLRYENFVVNVQGNVRIGISETSAPKFETENCFVGGDTEENQTILSCNVKQFDGVTTCYDNNWFHCRLSFPKNCSSALRYREVSLLCENSSNVFQMTKLIAYSKFIIALDLTANSIVEIKVGTFRYLNQLKRLYLGLNQIDTLYSGVFNGLWSVEELDLFSNQIETLPWNIFHNLSSLQKLVLWENKLITIDENLFQNLTNLTYMDLDKNKLRRLNSNTFRGLTSLETLWMGENKFSRLPEELFQDLKNLKTLSLWKNRITSLEVGLFAGLKNLRSLSLTFNSLRELPIRLFDNLSYLEELTLDHNNLEHLPDGIFSSLMKLKSIHLDNNDLHQLGINLLNGLIHLEIFLVNNNKLKRLDYLTFQNTPNLTVLDLANNLLQTVPNLNGLENLYILNLKGNSLRDVNRGTLSTLKSTESYVFVNQHEICECYVHSGINCSASIPYRSPFLTCDRLLSDRVLVAMMWFIGLNAMVGNAFVLWYKRKLTKNKVQTILCNNLALSDFLMGLYMIVIAFADMYFGEAFPMRAETWRTGLTCRIAGSVSILSSQASVFFVTFISIDRFISVVFPRSRLKLNVKSTKIAAVFIWTFAVALATIPSSLAGRFPNFYDKSHVCIGLPLALYESYSYQSLTQRFDQREFWFEFEISRSLPSGQRVGMYFSTAIFLGLNCACYLLIVFCYTGIIRIVYLSSKRAGLNSEMKTQMRLTLKVAAIVITDFLCWFPIILLGILVQAKVVTLPPSVFAWAVTFVLPINSAINPYLYTIADMITARRKEHLDRTTDSGNSQSQSRTGRLATSATVSSNIVTEHAATSRSGTEEQSANQQNTVILPNVPDNQNLSESNL